MRDRNSSAESADALRAKYAALKARVLNSPRVADLPVSDLKAPVPHVSTLRFIARQQGLVSLRQLLDQAATLGVVAYDIERGITLARTVEYLLARPWNACVSRVVPFPIATVVRTTEPSAGADEDAQEARDSFDDLNDSVDALLNTMAEQRMSRWVSDAIDQHIARVRGPLRPPFSGVSRGACRQLSVRSLDRLRLGIEGHRGQLLADLADAISLFGDRDARVARALIGVEDSHMPTLEEVGLKEGVSRERIRQVFSRFRARAISWRPPLASLHLLQSAIDRAGRVVTEFELQAALPAGVLSTVEELRVLDGLLRLGWLRGITATRFAGVRVHTAGDLPALEAMVTGVRRKAQRSLKRWGAVDLAEYEDLVGDDGPGLVYSLMLQRPFDLIEGWALLREPQATVMADRVRRVADVTPTLSQVRLRRALRKAFRALPPDPVWMAALQRDIPGARFDKDETVSLPKESLSRLSGSELLAQRLLQEQGGATTLRTLQRLFVREGMSAASAGVVFSRSPVLERFAPGVVGLVGGSVDAARIVELRKELKKDSVRALVGFRRVDGAVELLYKLDPDLVSSTLFLVPRDLIELGDWTVENSRRQVVVKKGYVSGLHRIAKAHVDSGARRIVVVFHPEDRTVHVAPR